MDEQVYEVYRFTFVLLWVHLAICGSRNCPLTGIESSQCGSGSTLKSEQRAADVIRKLIKIMWMMFLKSQVFRMFITPLDKRLSNSAQGTGTRRLREYQAHKTASNMSQGVLTARALMGGPRSSTSSPNSFAAASARAASSIETKGCRELVIDI